MYAKRSEVLVNVDEELLTDLKLSKFGFRSKLSGFTSMLHWAVMIIPVTAVVAIVTAVLLVTGTLRITNLSIPTYHL